MTLLAFGQLRIDAAKQALNVLLNFLKGRGFVAPLSEPLVPFRGHGIRIIETIWSLDPSTLDGLCQNIFLKLPLSK